MIRQIRIKVNITNNFNKLNQTINKRRQNNFKK